jgi:MFS family permease
VGAANGMPVLSASDAPRPLAEAESGRGLARLQAVAGPTSVFAASNRALTFGILLTITAIACEGMAVATVMPSVAQDLGGLEAYGWAFSAFMLASLVGAISAGEAADRRDIRLPAYIGFASFSLGLIVSGGAPVWPILLVGRCLQGFGSGNLAAISYVAVARGYPDRLRPRLIALLSSAWVMPALVGPAIAGQVAEHASWRFVFFGILPTMPIGALMLLPSLARLPEQSVEPSTAHGRVPMSVRLAVGVGLVLLAASIDVAVLAVAVAAAGVFLAVPALRMLLPPGTFTARFGIPAAVALRALLALGFFGSEALIPLGLSTQRGLPPSLVGLALTAGALAWVAGSWVQDRAEARSAGSLLHRSARVAAGLLLIAGGIGGVAAVVLSVNLPVELVVLAWGIGGLGMGLAYPGTTLTALGLAAPGEEGSAAAALQVAETVGTAIGTGLTGAVIALASNFQHPLSDALAWGFLIANVVIIAAVLPAIRLAPDLQWALLLRWRAKPTA